MNSGSQYSTIRASLNNTSGHFTSGVCADGVGGGGVLEKRGYSRTDTLTITSPQLSVEYKYNGTKIRDEIEVRAEYIHTFQPT